MDEITDIQGVALFALIAVLVAIWFLPVIVAWARGHHNTLAIFMTTLLLGWMGLPWVIALIWACTMVKKPDAERARAARREPEFRRDAVR